MKGHERMIGWDVPKIDSHVNWKIGANFGIFTKQSTSVIQKQNQPGFQR